MVVQTIGSGRTTKLSTVNERLLPPKIASDEIFASVGFGEIFWLWEEKFSNLGFGGGNRE
jgi:hypothetical protein